MMVQNVKMMEPFKNKNKDRIIKKIYNMNMNVYLIYAPLKNVSGTDYNGSYYIVDKKTGEWRSFNPSENFNLFDSALKNEIK